MLYVIGITIFFTFYEVIKTIIWPHMSLWESHFISIIMVAVLSTFFISWFRQIYDLQNQELRTVNEQAEEALKKSEEKYRTLVENLNDVIFTVDAEGYITYISPIIERFAGYKTMEIMGTLFMRIPVKMTIDSVLN